MRIDYLIRVGIVFALLLVGACHRTPTAPEHTDSAAIRCRCVPPFHPRTKL